MLGDHSGGHVEEMGARSRRLELNCTYRVKDSKAETGRGRQY